MPMRQRTKIQALLPVAVPADPLRDPDFIRLLQQTYVHPPAA